MPFSLPKLPYEYNELEPHIDEETMKTHHSKHHQTYINKLNKTISDNNIKEESLYKLLSGLDNNKNISEDVKQSIINNGGGHYNHSLFWSFMSPSSSTKDINEHLLKKLETSFDSLENFMKLFDVAVVGVFGSGWVWLCYDRNNGDLIIESTKDQDSPIMYNPNLVTILGLDVWEHAYYLKYKNNRPEYVSNWWRVVNWKFASLVYDKCVLEGKSLEVSADGYVQL